MKFLSITASLVLIALSSCSSKESGKETNAESGSSASVEEIIRANEVTLGGLQKMLISEEISTTGLVDAPPQSMVSVYPVIGGFVKEVYIVAGEEVRKGQPLFTLSHPDILKKQQEYLEEKAGFLAIEADWKRKQNLIKDKSVSDKAYQESENTYISAQSRINTLELTLKGMNLNPQAISKNGMANSIRIVSDIDGVVTELFTHKGEYVGGDKKLAEILDKSHLHIELQVRAQEIGKVRVGQAVRLWLDGVQFPGNVHLINPQIGANNFAKVHIHFDESQGNYKPGSFVQAQIIISSDTVFALPLTAVYESAGHSYALEVEKNELKPVEVQLGEHNDSLVEIKNYRQLKGKKLALSKVKYLVGTIEDES